MGSLVLAEIDARLSRRSRDSFSTTLATQYEQRLGPARRRHLALALLLTATAVVVAAMLDHANAPGQFERVLSLRMGVVAVCLAGIASVLSARSTLQEAAGFGMPLMAQAVLAAWAGAAGPPLMIDRNVVMSLMLFAVLCAVPPVPGKVARVLASLWFASFVAAFGAIEGISVLLRHRNAMLAGAAALAVGVYLSIRREAARKREFMQTVRAELSAAELGRANIELERLMHTDVLTNVANRRRFESDMQAAWQAPDRMAGLSAGLGLLLIDIDHFKSFNDAAGHAEGDACLRAVAGAIAAVVRGGAFRMARWGGEEFVVLAPGIARADMAALAERVRGAVETMAIPHPARPGQAVGVSVGGGWCGAGAPCQSPDDLLRRADAALYEAKSGGRNRVVVPAMVASLRTVSLDGCRLA